jgi:hypothetical protein
LPGFETRQDKEAFLFSKNIRNFSATHPDSYPILRREYNVKITTRLRLVVSLRMSGAITSLPLYAFMAWTRTAIGSTSFIKYTLLLIHKI